MYSFLSSLAGMVLQVSVVHFCSLVMSFEFLVKDFSCVIRGLDLWVKGSGHRRLNWAELELESHT